MSKTRVKPEAEPNTPYYSHLMPILERAVELGCEFGVTSIKRPFSASPNGLLCNLTGKVTMAEVLEGFQLPESIEIGGPYKSCIWDNMNNITLCIYPSD